MYKVMITTIGYSGVDVSTVKTDFVDAHSRREAEDVIYNAQLIKAPSLVVRAVLLTEG